MDWWSLALVGKVYRSSAMLVYQRFNLWRCKASESTCRFVLSLPSDTFTSVYDQKGLELTPLIRSYGEIENRWREWREELSVEQFAGCLTISKSYDQEVILIGFLTSKRFFAIGVRNLIISLMTMKVNYPFSFGSKKGGRTLDLDDGTQLSKQWRDEE